jgi:hypothetical protein
MCPTLKKFKCIFQNNLTAKGVESIASISQKAVTEGKRLNNEIKKLQTSIETARLEMAQSGR